MSDAAVSHPPVPFDPPPDTSLWRDRAQPVERRVECLLGQLTREEKLALMSGRPTPYGTAIPGVARLGVPPVRFSDGPAGLRRVGATAYPAPLALAATWDPELAGELGAALGEESRAHGVNALLGPMVNLIRVYHAGRTAETLGEDPHLAARLAVPLIRGIQDQSVLAVIKHFALHNQESGRLHVSAQVDDRTLHEIYLPAFEAAVRDAGVGVVMASLNKVGGTYASEHSGLLIDELRTRMGFSGFVVSSWEATHSVEAVQNGLSVELPVARYFGDRLRAALETGRIGEHVVDDHVRRILRSLFTVGLVDRPVEHDVASPGTLRPADTERWQSVARRVAERSVVLLKNDHGTLPLDPAGLTRLAVIGAASDPAPYGLGGTAWVPGRDWISPLRGLREALGERVDVRHVMAQPVPFVDVRPTLDALALTPPGATGGRHGLLAEYFPGQDLTGEPALRRVEDRAFGNWQFDRPDPALPEEYSVRWTADLTIQHTGRYTLGVEGFGPTSLHLGGSQLVLGEADGDALFSGAAEVTLEQGHRYRLVVEYRHQGGWIGGMRAFWEPPARVRHPDIERAAAVAAECDAAVVVVGTFQTEGYDRPTLSLPGAQDALVEAVAAANPRTVVVLTTGAPALLPWADRVGAIVQTWYGGEQLGAALAAALTGAVNPSGRLPVSFPRSAREIPTLDQRRFPGVDGRVEYSEDLLVGYRWYDATGNSPLFAFGHGLSYTTFTYDDLHLDSPMVTPGRPLELSVDVTNTGGRAGTEVVQVYVGSAHALDGPPRQLRAFRTVRLTPGEKRTVRFTLPYRDFCRWSPQARDWVAPPGQHRVCVGRSSADLPLRTNVTLDPDAGPCAVQMDTPTDVTLGSSFAVSATVQNLGQSEVGDLDVTLDLPAGWPTPEPLAGADSPVPGGGSATASWLVRPPSGTRTGPVLIRSHARYTAGGRIARVDAAATVTASYGRLAASFDNIGIGYDEATCDVADFCGLGTAYFGPALARAGLRPGRTVTCGDLYFTWPRTEPGHPDNTIADGQRIPISCAGRVIAFLGAGSGGAAAGVGTVMYVDGTTHPYAITLPDWLANHAPAGSEIVATVDQYHRTGALSRRSVSVYAASVPLLSSKAVCAFTLPRLVHAGGDCAARMHVFGVSIC